MGLWSDFWYQNNSQFFIANQVLQIDSVIFNSESFPNSNSNLGAESHISLTNFSKPDRTMSFDFKNQYLIDEFQNYDHKLIFSYDFDNDNIEEIIGVQDSIWWTSAEKFSPKNFYEIDINSKYLTTLTNVDNQPEFGIVFLNKNQLNVVVMEYNGFFTPKWSKKIDLSFDECIIISSKVILLIDKNFLLGA